MRDALRGRVYAAESAAARGYALLGGAGRRALTRGFEVEEARERLVRWAPEDGRALMAAVEVRRWPRSDGGEATMSGATAGYRAGRSRLGAAGPGATLAYGEYASAWVLCHEGAHLTTPYERRDPRSNPHVHRYSLSQGHGPEWATEALGWYRRAWGEEVEAALRQAFVEGKVPLDWDPRKVRADARWRLSGPVGALHRPVDGEMLRLEGYCVAVTSETVTLQVTGRQGEEGEVVVVALEDLARVR